MAEILPLATALEVVLRAVGAVGADLPAETVALRDALGRRLFDDLRADGPWPSTDRSAMDGFAVCAGASGLPAGTQLRVIGESLAGHPFSGAFAAGQAIAIMTGGVVPAGADAVVAVEETDGFGRPQVQLRAEVRAGQNVRKLGSEVAAGQLLIARGTRVRAAEVGALAVLGCIEVRVFRAPRVAILATGDEVVDIAATPLPQQVRNSNAHALAAQVRESGAVPIDLGIAADSAADLEPRLRRGLAEADVLLTIGGVSKGTHDLVHGTLRALGVDALFHGIELRPGKPTFFGLREAGGRRGYVFGLPGNPASCFTVFDLLVRPLLAALQGAAPAEAWSLPRAGALAKRNSREQAVPARLAPAADGLVARLEVLRPSGDPFSLLAGEGYALVPASVDPASCAQLRFVPFADGVRR
jgi:molybdopterin molybdotransferase